MKPHPRIRKTVKWGGAVVTVLLVVVWIGSGWWCTSWFEEHGGSCEVFAGCVAVKYDTPHQVWVPTEGDQPKPLSGLHCDGPFPFQFSLRPGWFPRGKDWALYIPMWLPLALLIITTAAVWRLDRVARLRIGLVLCPKCSYHRTGLAAGAVCPECGN